jgi:hypothetical protein
MAYTVTTAYTIATDGRISCVLTCTAADAGYVTTVINKGIGYLQAQTPSYRDVMTDSVTLGPFVEIADLTNQVAIVLAQIIVEVARVRAVVAGKPANATKTV